MRLRPQGYGRNLISTSLAGMAAGAPGTPPAGWRMVLPDAANGVNSSLAGPFVEDGVECLEWRLWGTPTISGNSGLFFCTAPAQATLTARPGDAFAWSCFVRRVAGAQPFYIAPAYWEFDALNAILGSRSTSIAPSTASLGSQRYAFGAQCVSSNVVRVEPHIAIGYQVGVAFDITLRIGLPKFERGMVATQPERRTSIIVPASAPPGAGTADDIDLNLVSAVYTGAVGDITVTQATSLQELNDGGGLTTFSANERRRTDMGLWLRGVQAKYLGRNGKDLNAWAETAPGWVVATRTDIGLDAAGFRGVTYESNNNVAGGLYPGALTETLADGDRVLIKVRVRASTSTGGLLLLMRTGANVGTTANGSSIANIANSQLGSSNPAVTMQDANAAYRGHRDNADGTRDFLFVYTVPAGGGGVAREFGINTISVTAGQKTEFRGMQVTRGVVNHAWHTTAAALVTVAADDVSATGALATMLTAAQGAVMLEYQGLDHGTLGTAGWTGSTAGALLRIGSLDVLRPDGPTGFSVNNGASKGALGISGNRGIVRIVFTWSASGWSAVANNGKVVTGSPLTLTGAVKLFVGVNGRLRRLAANDVRLSDADAKAWSSLYNRTFVRPGTALVPGNVVETFYDDFDADSLMTIASPAFPYASIPAMLDAYAPSWAQGKRWKPRLHNYTANANGSFPNHDGLHELQHCIDPQAAGNYPVIQFADSCLKGYTQKTSSLTAGQQALVPENPDTPGVKAKYVSWCVSTAAGGELDGADTNSRGGFYQRFGIFSCRAKFPAHQGSWPAWWLYRYGDTSELDIEEYYGFETSGGGPNKTTFAIHADDFAWNATVPPAGQFNVGYNLSQDQHDRTAVWVAGSVRKYFDGELIVTAATGGSFDAQPKYLILNMFIQGDGSPPYDSSAPAPDAAAEAAMPWISEIDRVTVLQFT